jgi:hypothetical protein
MTKKCDAAETLFVVVIMIVVVGLLSIITISTAADTKRSLDHDSEPHRPTAPRLWLSRGDPDSDSTTRPSARPVTLRLCHLPCTHIIAQPDSVTSSSSALIAALVSNVYSLLEGLIRYARRTTVRPAVPAPRSIYRSAWIPIRAFTGSARNQADVPAPSLFSSTSSSLPTTSPPSHLRMFTNLNVQFTL